MEQTVFANDTHHICELRVAGVTNPKDLAAAIVTHSLQGRTVRLSAIGHQAVGQALKAVPIANEKLVTQGFMVAVFPSFAVKFLGEIGAELERTACLMQLVRIRPF